MECATLSGVKFRCLLGFTFVLAFFWDSAVAEPKIYRERIEPNWLEGGTRFWYSVDQPDGKRDFVLIDAEAGTRKSGPDALAFVDGDLKFAGATDLPVEDEIRPSRNRGGETRIVFVNQLEEPVSLVWINPEGERILYGKLVAGGRRDQHTYAGHVWVALDAEKRIRGVFEARRSSGIAKIDGPPKVPKAKPKKWESRPSGISPNGKWRVYVSENDLWVRSSDNAQEIRLTKDATPQNSFRQSAIRERAIEMKYQQPDYPEDLADVRWSPDSKKLIALQTTVVSEPRVHYLEEADKAGSYPYLRAGDPIPVVTFRLFDVGTQREISVDASLYANAWNLSHLRWEPDSSRFTFLYNQRGHQVLRLLSLDAKTGELSTIVNEESETFIDYSRKTFLHFLEETDELIWMSERDGWNHLYRYDSRTGELKNQITKGEWVVRRVNPPNQGTIHFFANGIHPDRNPYQSHFCRVNLDGSGLKVLTEGDGDHEIQWSPDRRWFIDTWSRPDQPPIHELRTADGKRVCELERAELKGLEESGYRLPTPFSAKGRDGKTDIHGLILWPQNFDPARRYPIIEKIYAGPHGQFVPNSFKLRYRAQQIADAGFIVVQIDGMGTNWRSKAFHDVAWKNLGDAGFPDRIAWIRAAAEKFPVMDLDRVGVYGGSAGGQNAMRALIAHGDFYDVAVADCGCHDNRLDKIWWNEAWMGWPVGEHYSVSSNIDQAHRLQGDLLLIVGAMDRNVDPASTTKAAEALTKAGKEFELMVLPHRGHSAAESKQGRERRLAFFREHLLGTRADR